MTSMLRTLLFLFSLLVSSVVPAQSIHSDVPLFTGSREELHPHNFSHGDSFGCSSGVAFGDWKLVEIGEEGADERWLRLSNYGVIHCAAIETWSHDRADLGNGGYKYSWFVNLGRARRGKTEIELWALQTGHRPGSDYLLLSRELDPGIIKRFDVLPVDCPTRFQRKADPIDVWGTSYCSINSARELKAFAQQMAARAPAGRLTYEGPSPAEAE